jgi:HSP20 family protein
MVTQKITAAAADEQDAFLELPRKLDEKGRSAFALEAHETDNVVELTAELPGVQESDIEASLEGNILTISVEKRGQSEGKRTHFSERSYGRFERSIQLPFAPDADSVTAEVENGVLLVRFPRVETERTRRIAIRGAHSGTDHERRAIGATWEREPAPEMPLTLTEVAGPARPRSDLINVSATKKSSSAE